MEQKKSKFNTLGAKILILFGLLIISSIPRWFMQGTIEERQSYQNQAIGSVVEGWASRQKLGQVLLNIPYNYDVVHTSDGKKITEKLADNLNVAPLKLVLHVTDKVEYRTRGIFKIPIFMSEVLMEGTMNIPKDFSTKFEAEIAKPNQQRLYVELENISSVTELTAEIDGKVFPVKSGVKSFYIEFNQKTWAPESSFNFKIKAKLRGNQGIDFASNSDDFEVFLNSAWPHPSFVNGLPAEQNIDNGGFTARWKVSTPTLDHPFSVNFIEPMNLYSQTLRAIKYGFLICLLTLSVLFLIEILAKFKIHPMQYLLMSLPLSVFYILLLAFGEYVGFAWAYLIAASATALLLLVYFKGIGAEVKQCFGLGAVLTALYVLIYVMLSSEDSALLIGAISLFGCLASFMWLTRKLDWRGDKQSVQ